MTKTKIYFQKKPVFAKKRGVNHFFRGIDVTTL